MTANMLFLLALSVFGIGVGAERLRSGANLLSILIGLSAATMGVIALVSFLNAL